MPGGGEVHKTSFWLLHDLNLASMFAQRIVMLHAGRGAANGPVSKTITDELLKRVFDVTNAVSRRPPAGVLFVLPHRIGNWRKGCP